MSRVFELARLNKRLLSALGLTTIGLAASLMTAVPARADEDNWRRWHGRGHRPHEVIVVPEPGPVFVEPRPYYYPYYYPYYVAPPPVFVAPPVVYAEPSLNLVFPIRIH